VKIGELVSEIGRNPIFQLEKTGKAIAVLHPGVGAPLSAGFLEEMIAMGGRRFIACGGFGVLDETIAAGHPIVLDAAVRDEGTSYHYLPPDRGVRAANQAGGLWKACCDPPGLITGWGRHGPLMGFTVKRLPGEPTV